MLANELTHLFNPSATTIAEDMSAMPGMALPISAGGIGFDYRLSMGIPDFWIKQLKEKTDNSLDLLSLWWELTTRRPGEKNIGYSESHDQALVGDKTLMMWLANEEIYWNMDINSQSLIIDRAIALHKLIRLITFSLAGEGYLNFMGSNLVILNGLTSLEKKIMMIFNMLEDNGHLLITKIYVSNIYWHLTKPCSI